VSSQAKFACFKWRIFVFPFIVRKIIKKLVYIYTDNQSDGLLMSARAKENQHNLLSTELDALADRGFDLSKVLLAFVSDLPVLASIVDQDGNVIFASPGHTNLVGVPDTRDAIEIADDLFPDFVNDRFSDSWYELAFSEQLQHWDLSITNRQGHTHTFEVRHYEIERYKDSQRYLLTIASEALSEELVNERVLKAQKQQLNYASFHDPITGLANRSLFYDRIQKSLSRAKRSRNNLVLLLLDLNRFKKLNDSLGHDAGDLYLKHVARCLTDSLRDTDTVARLGSDEFAIALENIVKPEDIDRIINKIQQGLAESVVIGGHEVHCSASIGVSLFPKDGQSIDQLLTCADTAMSLAKKTGKVGAQFYYKSDERDSINYLLVENDLKRAIDSDELDLHYQPQIDIHSGRISGVEALVRWQHRERGMISPMEFIPLAEETGLIVPLGEWVLNRACKDFKNWMKNDIFLGKVAVNLSARQFRQENFQDVLNDTVHSHNLDPKWVEFELTESSAMENAGETIQLLSELASRGFSLAIDDFGTGYSSMAYLKRFPINKLKIDRSFVKDVDSDEVDAAIAKSIIGLAHNMGLQVIAEGVERNSQALWLLGRGCDQVQGYYYAKPMSETDLLAYIRNHKIAKIEKDGVYVLLADEDE
jgi:diguanylate cyclase (GGDEF)-like protein